MLYIIYLIDKQFMCAILYSGVIILHQLEMRDGEWLSPAQAVGWRNNNTS